MRLGSQAYDVLNRRADIDDYGLHDLERYGTGYLRHLRYDYTCDNYHYYGDRDQHGHRDAYRSSFLLLSAFLPRRPFRLLQVGYTASATTTLYDITTPTSTVTQTATETTTVATTTETQTTTSTTTLPVATQYANPCTQMYARVYGYDASGGDFDVRNFPLAVFALSRTERI